MTLHKASDGTLLTAGTVPKTAVTSDPLYTINETVVIRQELPGTDKRTGDKVLWPAGKVVKQSEIDAQFTAATASSITPNTGPAAGGTPVVIRGTNLRGVTGITFGGTAATALVVKSETEIRCTAPAHATGAVSVVFTDDSGTLTKTTFYTYV